MRKKWDEHTKLQLGKLIHKQLDMQVKLKDAVDRAAEILQAPRSTCMNYWQKELKDLDYTQEPLTLSSRRVGPPQPLVPIPSSSGLLTEEQAALLTNLLDRLKSNELKVRELYHQAGLLLNDYALLTKELATALDARESVSLSGNDTFMKTMRTIDIDDLAAGDIVRIHHHIWQDYYYISSADEGAVYGYKLNKNLRIRRKSKMKVISHDMLQFGKLVQRNVSMEEVVAE